MRLRPITISVIICLALVGVFSSLAGAAVVGHLTEVEGRVDLLKGGNLPAVPVKVNDTVAPKDVIRTKSLSKAQITFIDNSVLTISPESRIAIEEYMIDTAQGKRHAVLEIFQGMALAVVNKIFKVEEPDFVVKTQTAVMGVRGTEFGIRILPNSSTIMNFKGLLQVGNVFPEVSQLSEKASKLAYSFGPLNAPSNQWVFLKNMQATTVGRDLPPTLPYQISSQDREMFMRQLTTTGPQTSKFHQDSTRAPGMAMSTSPVTSTSPVSFNNPGEAATLAVLNTVTVPPTLVPQPVVKPITPVEVFYNILMSWGPGATDLDLHLAQPATGSVFHVYYGNQGSLTVFPYAQLNGDNTGTSGSEVITIAKFNPGSLYQSTVFNFGNQSTTSTNLSTTSGVSLKVIMGGTVVPLSTGGATVTGGTVVTSLTPTSGLAGNTWVAVTINPANGQVVPVNQIINTSGGLPAALTPAATPTPAVAMPAALSSLAVALTPVTSTQAAAAITTVR
jgi:FecR protein